MTTGVRAGTHEQAVHKRDRRGAARSPFEQLGRIAGTALGVTSIGIFAALVTYAALHQGNYPWIFGG